MITSFPPTAMSHQFPVSLGRVAQLKAINSADPLTLDDTSDVFIAVSLLDDILTISDTLNDFQLSCPANCLKLGRHSTLPPVSVIIIRGYEFADGYGVQKGEKKSPVTC